MRTWFNLYRLAGPTTLGLLILLGCVTNPISGQRQISIVGRNQLVRMAKTAVPAQFAADYGVVRDQSLNSYVSRVGNQLVSTLTRSDVVYPDMHFSFQVVNAVYPNAYAFPDGTIAITRGMLARLEDEAQLAAILGHEIAHVNAGHTAAAMSRGLVFEALTAVTEGYLESRDSKWAGTAGVAGRIGATVLLARYSREQERQADEGGMRYMVRAGYDPQGMASLTKLMVEMDRSNPTLMERMLSSHPISLERLRTAESRARVLYAGQNSGVTKKQEFLAATAELRKQRQALLYFAQAESLIARGEYAGAKAAAGEGLKIAPNDEVGKMLLAAANAKGR